MKRSRLFIKIIVSIFLATPVLALVKINSIESATAQVECAKHNKTCAATKTIITCEPDETVFPGLLISWLMVDG